MASDFTVTDGSVEYRHTKPRAEYESVVPFVRLNFTVADGSDAGKVASIVMRMAVETVEGALGQKVAEVKSPKEDKKQQEPASNPTAASTPPAPSPTPEPAPEPEPDLGLGDDEGVSLEELKGAANRAAKHVKAEFGNVNEVRKVINANGGNENILTIPEENRAAALEGFKSLLTLKKA